ncbi:MAG: glycoside hydrolase family 27 protein [Spirochaetales bacterium]|nr:glycoside hydrolase family 27 protein [Spirochaetales bacterium]
MKDKTPGPGLALTPPMGWNSYNTFGCEPTAALITSIADAIVSTGLKDAGYIYVNIDDGWMTAERDGNGNIVTDKTKFPNGLKALTDYIHSQGLKAGIYLGCGLRTYGEKAGSYGYEQKDADFIASAGFDFLKYDNRNLPEDPPGRDIRTDYTTMRDCLVRTGRQMVFSLCEHGKSRPWEWGREVGHLWRTTQDIKDGYEGKVLWGLGFTAIIDATRNLAPYAGPGGWNDPDMLVVGLKGSIDWQGPGCTFEEYKTHFSLWCLSSAPLLIGCDIRTMDVETREILINRELIAVDQDALGKQGDIVKKKDNTDIWLKPLSGGAYAAGLHNRADSVQFVSVSFGDLGLKETGKMRVRDLWEHRDLQKAGNKLSKQLPPHGCAVFKLTPAG